MNKLFYLFCSFSLVFTAFASSTEAEFSGALLRSIDLYAESDATLPKEEMGALVNRLKRDSYVREEGSDDLRVKFVGLQGIIEHVLACAQEATDISLIGVIHTPTPATPLCMQPEQDGSLLLDPSIRSDEKKLLTVQSRATIMREYLKKGPNLYVVYPQGGLEKRTPDQQKIYREAVERFPNLIDCKLSTPLAPDLIGATYLFRSCHGDLFAFSIKSRQANDIQPQSEWALWFGSLKDPAVAKRINEVFDALVKQGGPDLRKESF